MLGWSRRLALAALSATVIAACDSRSGDDGAVGAGSIRIATNPAGTNVYAVSAAIAKLLQGELGRRTTIRPHSGSSVYLPMLQRGEVELGLNTSIDGYLSYRGLAPYAAPMPNLRTLGMMFPLEITFMARADSGIERIEDLRGKRVVVTFRANAALEQLHRGILATGGLGFDDIEAITVAGLPEGVAALQEGRADAVPIGLGTALGLQANAALSDGIRYLSMGRDEARLSEIMPGTRIVSVTPESGVIGVPEPIRVSSVPDMLNTGVHMSDDDAYAIIRALHTHWDELRTEVSQLASQSAADIAPADNMHPYHPGAIRYWREAGLWTDAHEANQLALLALAHGQGVTGAGALKL
jgi:TRAP transporter TAXI family solute receptor